MAKTKVKVIVALFAVIALSLLAVCFGRLFSPAEAKAADGTYDDAAAFALMTALATNDEVTLTQDVVFDLTVPSRITGSGTMKENGHMDIVGNKTIDLAGFTLTIITGSENCCVEVTPNASLTIKDSSAAGTGKVVGQSAGDFAWGQTGTSISLTNVDVEFTSTETGAAGDEGMTPGGSSEDHVILSNGSVELSGVTFDTNVSDPVAVFTKNAETGEFVGSDVTYGTLQDAINATGYNEYIQVSDKIKSVNAEEKSVTESIVIPEGQKINLDLNGYTLKNVEEAGKYAAITNNGELYVYNGTIAATSAAKMSSSNDDDYIPYGIYNNGTLIASNVEINATATGSGNSEDKPTAKVSIKAYGIYNNAGSVTISGGKVYASSASYNSYALYNTKGALNINGGEYVVEDKSGSLTVYTIYSLNSGSSIKINGGTFKADGGTAYGMYIKSGSEISNATIAAVGKKTTYGIYANTCDVKISDSSITATTNAKNAGAHGIQGAYKVGLTLSDVAITAKAEQSIGRCISSNNSSASFKALSISGEDTVLSAISGAEYKSKSYAVSIYGSEEKPEFTFEDGTVKSGGFELGKGTTTKILSGTFEEATFDVNATATLSISGGTFAEMPSPTYLASDEHAIYRNGEAGSYTYEIAAISSKPDVKPYRTLNDKVTVGDRGFDSVAAAVKAINDGTATGPITLIASVEEDIVVTSGSVAIDLNGNTVTGNVSVSNGATLSIEGVGKVTGMVSSEGTLTISGGTFGQLLPKEWLATGTALSVNDDLAFTVVQSETIATMTKADDTSYIFDSLQSATYAAPIGEEVTITLEKDITADGKLISASDNRIINYDLNGKKITFTEAADDQTVITLNSGTYTFTNGTITRVRPDGWSEGKVNAIFEIFVGTSTSPRANVTFGEDFTAEATNGASVAYIYNYANLTVDGATLKSDTDWTIHGFGGEQIGEQQTTINIKNGTVESTGAAAIYQPQVGGTINVSGGTVRGVTGIEIRNGALNVTGGTIIATGGFSASGTPSGGGSTVSGAAVAVTKYNNNETLTVNISGGELIAEGANGHAVYEGYPDSEDGKYPEGNELSLTVSSGEFTGAVDSKNETGFISGGEFDGMPESDYIAAGADLYMNADKSGFAVATESAPEGYEKVVATIGDTAYTSLAEAVTAAGENATIVLYADVTESVTVAADDVITLDLNGYKLTNVAGQHTITNNGTLTIVGNGTVDNVSHGRAALLNNPNATMTVLGGTYRRTAENAGNNSFYVIQNKGTMTIGGTGASDIVVYAGATTEGSLALRKSSLVTSGWYSDAPDGGAASLTINRGSFYGGNIAIKCDEKTSLTINGGVFNAYNQAVQSWTNTKITNGTFNGIVAAWTLVDNTTGDMIETPSALDITGGTFNGAIVANRYVYLPDDEYATEVNDNADVDISGGEFSMAFNSDFLADNVNLYQTETGFAAATEQNAPENATKVVAFAGDKAYGSIQEAINAADGAPVTLYDDVMLSEALTIDKAVIIDLNGKTVSASTTAANITASATIKNGTIDYVGDASVNGLVVTNNATLTLDGVTVDYEGSGQAVRLGDYNGGTPTENGGNAVITDSVIKGGVAGVAMFGTAEGAANKTTLTATDSTITGSVYYGIATNGIFYNNDITLSGTTVKGTSTGMYLPGSGETTITGGSVEGATGIEIRAGKLTIDGATVTATGAYEEPVPNGDGTTVEGVAIAVSQHTTERPIEVTVNGGTFNATGKDGKAFLEIDTVKDEEGETTPSEGVTIAISGGNFTAPVESKNKTEFVSGGNFSEVLDSAYLDENVNMYVSEGKYTAATENNKPDGAQKVVATVNGKGYASLQAAIDAADGAIVTLYDDVTLSETIVTTENVTIDFAGKTIATSVKAITATNGAVVTLSDGTITYTGSDETITGLVAETGAKLVLNKMTVSFPDGNVAIRLGDGNGGDGGMLELTDSTVYGGAAGVGLFGSNNAEAPSSMTAKNSKIYYTKSFGISTNGSFANNAITLENTDILMNGDVPTGAGIYLAGAGTTDITGGTIEGATGIEIRAGKLTINEGTIVKADGDYAVEPNGNGSTVVGVAIAVSQHTTERPIEVTVNGGTFNATGKDGKAFLEIDTVKDEEGETTPSEGVTIAISGGNFTAPVESKNKTEFVSGGTFTKLPDSSYLGENVDMYAQGGKFTAATAENAPSEAVKVVAMVDDKAYDDLNEAIANANGQTVELYKDIESITVASDSDVTIDLNGNSAGKITVNAPTTKAAGGTVTFTDGYASSLVANGSSVALENVAFGGTGKGNAITLHEGATVAMNGGSISSYDIGIYVGKRGEAVSSLTVTGVEFSDIPSKGIYGEAIGDLSVTDNIFGTTGTGTGGSLPEMQRSSAAIDINQTMAGGNVTISGNKFNNCGTEDGSTSGAVKIKVRNIPVEQAAGQAGDFEKGATYVGSFESITVSGNTYTGCVRDIVLGTGYVAETVPSSDVLTITEAETVKVTDFGRVDDEEALKGALADTDLTVIKLAGDVELTEAVAVSRAVTIDLNGYDITGNINVTAADVTITAPETSDSAINGIVTVTNADDFTLSNVTVNYTVTGEEEADSLKGAVVIDGSENATIDNVTVNVTANNSGLNVVSVWVKNDSTATISDSTIDLEFRATEENRTQGQVVRAETSDLTIKDSVITTTDYGVIFYGDMSATDAQADNTAAFDKLVIENSTVTVTDTDEIVGAYAVSGNGSNRNGTIIEITGSTITSDVATAIYHPQYGNMTITDSVITGASGIEMRSGNLTVTSGTITATGDFEVEPNGNGNTASGVAVAVSQHTTEMKINVQLNGGTFNATGENGKAFYETDTVTGADPSADVTVDLNGGTYEAAVEAKNIKNFINDGLYKEEPKEDAFAEGYEGVLYNGYYQVVEATTDDPAALLTAKTEAQADVRSYLLNACGMTIADVKALAADETLGAAAQAVIDAYAAMDGATSLSKLAIARLSVMDAIDALDKALDTALAEYKAAAIEAINSYGAEKDVAVPTATIMAINSAKTEAEVDMYKEYAIGEIDDIVAYREAISNIKIPNYSDTLDALSDKLDTLTGNLASVSNDLGAKIDAVKTDIATVTADIDKLETTLAGLADSDDVNGIAEDISDIIEQLAAIKSTVDGISVAVDEATAVEEVKTEAAAEIDAWLEDYIDSIVESSATSVRDILTAKAAMADDLRSKLVDAFGEDNAALIEKYYDDAMSAIENATSASEATNAVSTFKAQVASVEAAAGNTTSLAGVYVLLAIILVVAIVAVVLAVVLKRKGGEPAPATAQPAPEAAPAPAPAAETAPAPAATEEAPAAQPEDENAATATDEDTERVVITASTRTFEEAYEALDPELRDLFDKVKAYALSKNGTTEVKLSNCICIKYGSKKVVRLTVRRSYPLAMFVIENEMVKDFRRNATGALKLKVPATELVIRDEEDLKAAYSMVDLAVDQILKDIEAAKERRRAARRARRAQREAEAGEAGETPEAPEAPDDGGKK